MHSRGKQKGRGLKGLLAKREDSSRHASVLNIPIIQGQAVQFWGQGDSRTASSSSTQQGAVRGQGAQRARKSKDHFLKKMRVAQAAVDWWAQKKNEKSLVN